MNHFKMFHRVSSLFLVILIVAACQTGPPARPTPLSAIQPSTYIPSPELEQPSPTPESATTPTFTSQPLPLEPTPTSPPPLAPSPPGNPTALPPPPASPNALASARVELEAQPATAAVGELFTLTGRPTNPGLPQYTLYLRGEPAIIIRYDGELIFQGFTGEVVEFVSASAGQSRVEVKLRAAKPGTVEAIVSVSGEVQRDTGGSMPVFFWSSASSPGVTLTVTGR